MWGQVPRHMVSAARTNHTSTYNFTYEIQKMWPWLCMCTQHSRTPHQPQRAATNDLMSGGYDYGMFMLCSTLYTQHKVYTVHPACA